MKERKPQETLTKSQIKKIAAKVAADHKGQPKPQLLVRRTVKDAFGKGIDKELNKIPESVLGKKVSLGRRNFVGWGFVGNDFKLSRRVVEIEFIVDFTKSTKKDIAKLTFIDVITRAIDDLVAKGWHISDGAAFRASLDIIANNLDHLANDIYRDEICRTAAGNMVLAAATFIKQGRTVLRALKKVNTLLNNRVSILPDFNKYEIKNGELVAKKCECKGKSKKSSCKCSKKKGKK